MSRFVADFLFVLINLFYLGNLIVLITFNFEFLNESEETINEQTFHNIEFVSGFIYNLSIFLITSYNLFDYYNLFGTSSLTTKFIVMDSIVGMIELVLSYISMLLVYFQLELYEVPSHRMEYTSLIMVCMNEIIITFFFIKSNKIKMISAIIYMCIIINSIVCMIFIPTYEVTCHFIEFFSEIILIFISSYLFLSYGRTSTSNEKLLVNN